MIFFNEFQDHMVPYLRRGILLIHALKTEKNTMIDELGSIEIISVDKG